MTIIQILVLGLIQGLTEFLPVSSSAHLVLLPHLFGWAEQGLEMDVALHVGTLTAVLLYFRRDVGTMATHFISYGMKGFRRQDMNEHVRLAWSLIVATLPAVMAGFFLKQMGLGSLRQVPVIATTSIVFAIVLWAADYFGPKHKGMQHMTPGKGFLIGLGQAIALVPGVSRSGICISVGLALGFNRLAAARFAFLMSVPSIIGAATLTFMDAFKADKIILWQDMGLGICFSALAGLGAIQFMLTILNRHSLNVFVIYRLGLGTVLWALL